MRLLDLFSGAGGAAYGYHLAGFTDITGVDHVKQSRYPFRFIQADALEYLTGLIESSEIGEYGLIHASPPCQRYTRLSFIHKRNHPDLIEATRRLLLATGKPFVIENVEGAPLHNPLMLCGTMFRLDVQRHRLFECRPVIWFPPAACCHYKPVVIAGRLPDLEKEFHSVYGNFAGADQARRAMGIDWMTRNELAQAIPPAYCEYIGRQLMAVIQ